MDLDWVAAVLVSVLETAVAAGQGFVGFPVVFDFVVDSGELVAEFVPGLAASAVLVAASVVLVAASVGGLVVVSVAAAVFAAPAVGSVRLAVAAAFGQEI